MLPGRVLSLKLTTAFIKRAQQRIITKEIPHSKECVYVQAAQQQKELIAQKQLIQSEIPRSAEELQIQQLKLAEIEKTRMATSAAAKFLGYLPE
jgi:hypothetical protein